jgi:hypothetical protein
MDKYRLDWETVWEQLDERLLESLFPEEVKEFKERMENVVEAQLAQQNAN